MLVVEISGSSVVTVQFVELLQQFVVFQTPPPTLAAYATIEPLVVREDARKSLERLRSIVTAMPGAQVIEARPDYLYAQFTSGGLRFVDDTEFWFSPGENTIHVRSASRLGRRDFHVNRKRVEAIRAAYSAS